MYLKQHREVMANELSAFQPLQPQPIELTDPFLATAVLQKSLRRADGVYAHGAAQALLAMDPARLWRRLVVVACEDFGLSDVNLTAKVIAAASDRSWRKKMGGDALVISYLVGHLLRCPRDRRVDETYMLAVAMSCAKNPDAAFRQLVATTNLAELLRLAVKLVLLCEQVVPYRGVRAIIATECDVALARMARMGWIDRGLEQACMQARRTSQCLLPVILPMLKAVTEKAGGTITTVTRATPEARDIEGLPGYAYDGYTRPGRVALMTLARQDRRLASLLAHLPTAKTRMDALINLLFVVEGGVCTTELSDPLYEELKRHSLGCWAGLPEPALAEGLAIMSDAIPALNDIRVDLVGAATWTR